MLEQLRPLGDCSYTLYVIHVPIVMFISGWLMSRSPTGALPTSFAWTLLPAVIIPFAYIQRISRSSARSSGRSAGIFRQWICPELSCRWRRPRFSPTPHAPQLCPSSTSPDGLSAATIHRHRRGHGEPLFGGGCIVTIAPAQMQSAILIGLVIAGLAALPIRKLQSSFHASFTSP